MARHIGLTTVRQPAFELGRTAMLYLNDLISGATPPPVNILDPSVVIRSSCDLVRK